MTKRKTNTPSAGRYRRWGAALMLVTLMLATFAGSIPTLHAQSVLRFVEPGSEAPSVAAPLPAPVITAVPAEQASSSEFRFLDLKESKTPPLPQFSVTGPRESSRETSTLNFTPPKSDAAAKTDAKRTAASELRFLVAPQVTSPAPITPQYNVAEVVPNLPLAAAPIVSEMQNVASATELFGMPPQTRPNAFKPRILSVFEHVPATVSRPAAAEPVRATREAGPAYAPKGTELFASTAPKQWDLPALDYGSALSHAEPPQPVVATPKPIEPMRIVARELPQSATEMFGLGAPEKLTPPQPIATVQAAPQPVVAKAPVAPVAQAAPVVAARKAELPLFTQTPIAALPPRPIVAPTMPAPVAVKPEAIAVSQPKIPAAAELDFSRVPVRVEPPKPAVQPQLVAAAPVAAKPVTPVPTRAPIAAPPTQVVAAPASVPRVVTPAKPMPVPKPVKQETLAVARPQLPAASDLDFSHVPAHVEPVKPQVAAAKPVERKIPEPTATQAPAATTPVAVAPVKPQFLSAAPTYVASAPPIAVPTKTEQLVPANVAQPTAARLPFEYELGKLANETAAAEAQRAATVPPTTVPDRRQVTVTPEPSDPNVYTFRYAGTTNGTPAHLANNMQPAPAGMSPTPVEVGPEAVDAGPEAMALQQGCNGGCYGQYGCPYLPGQSGTRALCGVDCGKYGASCNSTWGDAQCIPWALFGPGEYVGPARPAHVETYFLRVNDNITLTFIASRKKSAEHYRIGVGDELQIEWLQGAGNTETPLDRKLLVQPDGTVTLPLIGEVVAAGKTINDFRDEAVKLYGKYQRDPQITVTPLTVNVAVQDVLKAVTSKDASSGQTQDVKVTPEGTIQAAGIGSVYVQGLTLDELRSELEARYAEAYGPGLAVSPQLTERATSYVFIGGEVRSPGRYTLEGPTTVMQAIAMAGSWNNGGNVRQVVVFRRDENWCLKATKIDVRAPLYGKDPCPTNDVWLRENDLVLVPKSCILCATDLIELYFTRGVYAVFPINYVYDFSSNSSIVPVP